MLKRFLAKLPSAASKPTAASATRAAPSRSEVLAAELSSAATPVPQAVRPEILAAVAVGPRLLAGLSWEWSQLLLEPSSWRQTIAVNRPDLLLVEVDGATVPGWAGSDESALGELLDSCKAAAVPVMVWVTTGAPAIKVADAITESAEYVFVADPELVDTWRTRAPQAHVEHLGPAAAPRVHNPVAGGAGTRRDLGACLVVDAPGPAESLGPRLATVVGPAVLPLSSEVDVWALGDVHELPPVLRRRLVGTEQYDVVTAALGRYRVLLDAGRATTASTWSALEAGASQTAIVTLPEEQGALPTEVAEHTATGADPKSLRSEIVARLRQAELRDREGIRLQRAVLAAHTYSHRVDRMLAALGRDTAPAGHSVSAVVPTNREHEIDNILANVGRQSHSDVELVLVVHGLGLDHADLRSRARDAGVGQLVVIDADEKLTLGACMNLGVDAASGVYVAKMDDDNFYGHHYLQDLLQAFDYTDAGIVGKWAHYVWLRASGAVVLRYASAEHSYERRIQGGSMLFDRDVVRDLRFGDLPRAVDSDVLDRAAAAGVKIYSADRFNFVSVRGADRHAHTWAVADSTFMTDTGQLVFYGDPRPHVEV